MSKTGDRIRRKLRSVGSLVPATGTGGDSTCFFCSQPYNIGREGQHHFPACDVCRSLEHPGCQHP